MEKLDSFTFQNYKILHLIGEGSFGKVFKAAEVDTQNTVALKILLKRGRSTKELSALKQEANIQQNLRHPNIIQLFSSFETEKELVFVCEYAVSDLHKLLAKVGSLGEIRTQKLSYDLISALYYLHSHRILHRDLKPPNILLDKNYKAKLCDFGLARNMTLGTQILTSIKGTPLYMAPELLEGRGYGHEADLWSLGCIIYEMLAGESPFNTRSILHLMQLIRYANIKWPSFLSTTCISFLKGLLINNPANRMSWNEILDHSFVKGNILILSTDKSISDSPFTRSRVPGEVPNKPLRKVHIHPCDDVMSSHDSVKVNLNLQSDMDETDNEELANLAHGSNKHFASIKSELPQRFNLHNVHQFQKFEASKAQSVKPLAENSNMVMHRFMDNVDPELQQFLMSPPMMMQFAPQAVAPSQKETSELQQTSIKKSQKTTQSDVSTHVSSVPVETEEWLQFIFKSMQEILDGDLEIYKQENMMTMIIGLLRDTKFNSKIIEHVVQIICLPYAIDMPKLLVDEIDRMYLQLKLVPNLVYASKLLCQRKIAMQNPSSEALIITEAAPLIFNNHELRTLASIYDLVVYLVYSGETFLHMLCDAMAILNLDSIFRSFILSGCDGSTKEAYRLTNSILALICAILQNLPENSKLIENVILHETIELSVLLQHHNDKVRLRAFSMLRLLGRFCCFSLQNRWDSNLSSLIHNKMVMDDNEDVKKEAQSIVEEFKHFGWFKKIQ